MPDSKVLILTVGLPRSGKSTWSRKQGHPVVCPDAIRLAMHGRPFVPSAERLVWASAHLMVESLFLAGHPVVILDATNVTRKRRDEWRSTAYSLCFHHVDTPLETCLQRADVVNFPRGVVERMAREFEPLGADEAAFVPLGATGDYPRGKLDEHDEGGLRPAIVADPANGVLRIEFGKPVAWLGLPRVEALQFANLIVKNANKLP